MKKHLLNQIKIIKFEKFIIKQRCRKEKYKKKQSQYFIIKLNEVYFNEIQIIFFLKNTILNFQDQKYRKYTIFQQLNVIIFLLMYLLFVCVINA